MVFIPEKHHVPWLTPPARVPQAQWIIYNGRNAPHFKTLTDHKILVPFLIRSSGRAKLNKLQYVKGWESGELSKYKY